MRPGRGDAAALAALGALFAARFHEALSGGTLYLRDAGFFFVPWRTVLSRLLRAGELPLWNDAMGNGRALAANPTGAVFWPLSTLHLVLSPTGVAMANAALTIALVYAALRLLRLSPFASAGGAGVVLLSGVFQSLPVYFGMLAAGGPLALALGAFGGLDLSFGGRRRAALAGLGLGMSFLAGEPAVAAMGALAVAGLAVGRGVAEPRRRVGWAGALGLAGLLAVGVSAVQLLPAVRELARSARGREMKAADGALFWSVRPARLATLLEPRLAGDPSAERDDDYWGAGTFDAGNPYFLDLSVGVLPLALALAGSVDPRGRASLALAGGAVLLGTGRHLPGYAALVESLRPLALIRYPEKWWLVATLGLAAAAAVGLESLRLGDPRARRRLGVSATVLASLLFMLAALAHLAPARFRDLLWSGGLGTGPTAPERLSEVAAPGLVLGGAALWVLALLARLPFDRFPDMLRGAASVTLLLFLLDGGRRVAGTCPTRPAAEALGGLATLVVERSGGGRFYDDGADRRDVAVRRTREGGGFDALRPEAGVAGGIRYAGENDVDRMMPARSVAWARTTAALPWGSEKMARLRAAGVSQVRTYEAGPDPDGVIPLARSGGDRLLEISSTRPTYAQVEEARQAGGRIPPGWDPLRTTFLEVAGGLPPRRVPAGSVRLVERRSDREVLEIDGSPGAALVIARTHDPCWKATIDGRPAPLLLADGAFSAVLLPADARRVVLEYRNPLLALGALITLTSLLGVVHLIRPIAKSHSVCEDPPARTTTTHR